MVQQTDYPWSGKVSITVNPKAAKKFTVFVRVPNRTTSELYTPTPAVSGLKSLAVNGEKILPKIENGYAAITREWSAGDKIELELPMEIQVVRADNRIKADRGHLALRYGPLIYNLETTDQPKLDLAPDLKSLHLPLMVSTPPSRSPRHWVASDFKSGARSSFGWSVVSRL